jgi:chromosome partitioning protein
MAKTIAIVNQKGGVGKTATSYNGAYAFAELLEKKTLLIDMDPSANSTEPYCDNFEYSVTNILEDSEFDIKKSIYQAQIKGVLCKNLYIIPTDISLALMQYKIAPKLNKQKLLKKQIDKIADEYDYILLDCPPLLSEFTVLSLYAADFIVIPLRYEKDSVKGIKALFNIMEDVKEGQYFDYKILRTGLDARKKDLATRIDNLLLDFVSQDIVFKTIIRQDEEINKAKSQNEPIFTFAPKSRGALDYLEFIKELSHV